MAKVRDIVDYFEELAPSEMKMDFDNVGLLAGIGGAEVSRVLVALDPSPAVIDEAESLGAQMIIAHHPLFFDMKAVNDSSVAGAAVVRLLRAGISCLCLHTNLDCVKGGVNDALAEKLGVASEGYLEGPFFTSRGVEYGMGRWGLIKEPASMSKYLSFVQSALGAEGLRYHDGGRPVHRVALCGGSGGEYVEAALARGCDTLVTADVKYHQFLDARARGLNLIDGGHFCTENVIVPVLAEMMKRGFPNIKTTISTRWGKTIKYFV